MARAAAKFDKCSAPSATSGGVGGVEGGGGGVMTAWRQGVGFASMTHRIAYRCALPIVPSLAAARSVSVRIWATSRVSASSRSPWVAQQCAVLHHLLHHVIDARRDLGRRDLHGAQQVAVARGLLVDLARHGLLRLRPRSPVRARGFSRSSNRRHEAVFPFGLRGAAAARLRKSFPLACAAGARFGLFHHPSDGAGARTHIVVLDPAVEISDGGPSKTEPERPLCGVGLCADDRVPLF